ncbi:uncharacterized protein [Pocillopora verrucosa]|uniref:uncharacterized protein n=1 Tax=Pocillopora verrucosa TaxID=203993 RepID=UPI0033401167
MKWVTAIIALSLLSLFSNATNSDNLDETFTRVSEGEEPNDFNKHKMMMMTGKWNNKIAVKVQIPSMDVELKLIYEKNSIEVNSKAYGYARPKHSKIFKCKEIPEYLRNTTCSDHEVFEITTPALISRMWNFTVSVMTQVHDGTLEMTSGIWKKCIMVSRVVIGKVWYGLQYIWIGTVNWTREKFEWFSDLTWIGAKRWVGKLIWNCTEWLAWILWNGLQCLADFTITATYVFSEMVQNKSAELIQMMIYGVTWIVKPFVPVICYIADVAVDLYFGFLHDHVKQIETRFDFVSWQDGVYAFSAGLVVNVSLLVAGFLVCRLCVRTVKFIGRKWKEYKDRKAAANMPPKPQKPIWQPKRKHKKKKRIDDW